MRCAARRWTRSAPRDGARRRSTTRCRCARSSTSTTAGATGPGCARWRPRTTRRRESGWRRTDTYRRRLRRRRSEGARPGPAPGPAAGTSQPLLLDVVALLERAAPLDLALEDFLVEHDELHASILRHAERGGVRCDRPRLAVAADRVLARPQAGELLGQVDQHRAGPGLAQQL